MKLSPPITPSSFYRELVKLGSFRQSWKSQALSQPRRIGVCVSGGPDSMALAYLLQNVTHPLSPDTKLFQPRAFVVDHAARDGSHNEALWVKAQLEHLGIETQVTQLAWPSGIDPGSMQGFEKEARSRRYRALAFMASTNYINDLFTGHHQDDQVETMLLRLLRDRTANPNSFQGMLETTSLPDCEDLLFATQSSAPYPKPGIEDRPSPTGQSKLEQFFTGIQLHRPLLSFHKSDLLAICDYHNIPYVQDKTNFDPKLTPRNAIRHLRTTYKLPHALGHEPLLHTLAKARAIHDDIKRCAHQFRNWVLKSDLHSDTGVLYLRLKPLPLDLDENQMRGFSYLMCRIAGLLSPLPPRGLPTMLDQNRTERLCSMTRPSSVGEASEQQSEVFCKVLCQSSHQREPDASCTLLFSRQSMSRRERTEIARSFELKDVSLNGFRKANQFHSHPLLWDNRFWIDITTDSEDILNNTMVRAYDRADTSVVKQALRARGLLSDFEKRISVIAPGQVRYTLPVLVVHDEIVAFPTLGLAITPRPPVHWQVQYARDLRSIQFLFPDTQNGEIRSWNFAPLTNNTETETKQASQCGSSDAKTRKTASA